MYIVLKLNTQKLKSHIDDVLVSPLSIFKLLQRINQAAFAQFASVSVVDSRYVLSDTKI